MNEDALLKVKKLEEDIKCSKNLGKTYFQLGVIYQKEKIDSEAIKYFHKAISISPKYGEAYYRLALLLNKERKLKESLDCINSALKSDSQNPKYHELLGNFYFRDKRYDKAEEEYKFSLKIDNTSHRCNFRLSKLFEVQGLIDKAIHHIVVAINIDNDNSMYFFQLSELYIKLGDANNALRIKHVLLDEDNCKFNFSEKEVLIRSALFSGELALIPAGFRCYTKGILYKRLKFSQPSMPFDSGFFPPDSVANVLIKGKVNLNVKSHNVCIKDEKYLSTKYGQGIKFAVSNYNEINKAVEQGNNLGRYLDSTYGYYTLDNENGFVLAHYNWHRKASVEKSKGIYDVNTNLSEVNAVLTKRIKRMMTLCNKAERILFVIGNTQNYKYMQIDNEFYFLDDISKLKKTISELYGSKAQVVMLDEVNDAESLYNYLYTS
ncbi:tetratricopeptide repeat protein [Pseudoalteromonas sp. Xi13]|uniref:tetratricopeptide repeat protein n=1 Tax=Pseudoalteromonas sp. Xi13 TaxID=2490635 RepID=UPI000F751C31|nr:tetratricopeptide repeat protein [Pseudoalteromonas sp. Xi13]AZN31604.1 tetratricopeptide repeat protein [Pseudoalteromonas sp. Xi13]